MAATEQRTLTPDVVVKGELHHADNQFLFQTANGVALRIEVLTPRILRFRYSTDGLYLKDFSYALNPEFQQIPCEIEFKDKDEHYRITTGRVICLIQKQGMKVRLLNRSGQVICEDETGFSWEELPHGGGKTVSMSKQLFGGEFFYGLGDKTFRTNLRNHRAELWGSDVYGFEKDSDPLYKNIPFYFGLHQKVAYGVFFDNSFRSYFDFGKETQNITKFGAVGGEMNYYVIYGPTLIEVAEQYTDLTGRPELPPLWALGYHQCKWSYYPESKVREIAEGFRKRKIPCDALYLDIDYMDGFRCFTWDSDKFPQPDKMIRDLSQDGFKTVVIIDPGIKTDPNYSVFQEGLENDYFCRRADGEYMKGVVWPGSCYFPDFTRPAVREWWAGLFKGLIAENGVSGVWNDMNEPALMDETIKTFPDDVRHDYDGHPCSHRKAHNVYGMQMARATYEGVKRFAPDRRPFVITRSCYAGAQRFTCAWTGDNKATWEHLWLANIQCQRMSISGMSFIGTDIGGFIEQPTPELYARWIQLGVFHPFCRTHSSGDHGDQEPWSFTDEVTQITKKFIELRYQLLPYLYTTFWQYVSKGTPMLRPLAFVVQKDIDTYHRMMEFTCGDHLLLCPITNEGANGRWVYLPENKWYYYWTDEVFNGGAEVWADAPLDKTPLYVREGAVIPFYPVQQYVGEKELKDLALHVYFSEQEISSQLYEDAGEGYAYREGACQVKTFRVKGEAVTLQIQQQTEGNFDTSYKNYKMALHGLPFTPKTCQADGETIAVSSTKIDGKSVWVLVVKSDFSSLLVSE